MTRMRRNRSAESTRRASASWSGFANTAVRTALMMPFSRLADRPAMMVPFRMTRPSSMMTSMPCRCATARAL